MNNSNQKQMGTIKFFKESVKNLKTIGTITRSSKYLCQGMIKPVDFDKAKVIVELGAGDGVVTKHILAKMRSDALLLAFELNSKFCDNMREIKDDRLVVIEDDALKVESYLEHHGHNEADYIISALPFTIFPEELSYKIIRKCKQILNPAGLFVQIHYSLIPKKLYMNVFGNVKLNFVAFNVPPAWVMVCRKEVKQ